MCYFISGSVIALTDTLRIKLWAWLCDRSQVNKCILSSFGIHHKYSNIEILTFEDNQNHYTVWSLELERYYCVNWQHCHSFILLQIQIFDSVPLKVLSLLTCHFKIHLFNHISANTKQRTCSTSSELRFTLCAVLRSLSQEAPRHSTCTTTSASPALEPHATPSVSIPPPYSPIQSAVRHVTPPGPRIAKGRSLIHGTIARAYNGLPLRMVQNCNAPCYVLTEK